MLVTQPPPQRDPIRTLVRVGFALLWASTLAPMSAAWAFPADDAWITLKRGSVALLDPTEDRQGGSWNGEDVVGTTVRSAGFWAADASSLYLRMRVVGDPRDGGSAPPGDAGWAFLVDVDPDPADADDAAWEVQVGVGGADAEITVWTNPNGVRGLVVGLDDPVASDAAWGDLDGGEVRFVEDGAGDWFVDVALSRALLEDVAVVDASRLRIAVVAGLRTVLFDVGGCDDRSGACTVLGEVLADAFTIDGDGDGLTSDLELRLGLRTDDPDTDDDGVPDPLEITGTSDDGVLPALDCDSDGDRLPDGLEDGVVDPPSGTDTRTGCFRADDDPSTHTDPLAADTDEGGIPDGVEDQNRNGRVDAECGETDPRSAADDADTDADGVADVLEAAGLDGEIDDEDSDGDGVPDAVEGVRDPDRDCIPAFLDLDADGDGYPDAVEGGGDLDEDGLPDNVDADADGDGRPDAWEGDDDIDCDGVIDRLDAHDFDGYCDAPTVDTGPLDPAPADTSAAADRYYGGGACQTGGPGPFWLAFVALIAVVRRGWPVAIAIPGVAAAQQADVQRLVPAVGGAFVTLPDPRPPERDGGGVGAWITLADDPLVERPRGDGDEISVVDTLWTAYGAAFGQLGPATVGVVLPVHLRAGDEAGLGDVALDARVGFGARPLALSPWVRVELPTGGPRWGSAGVTRVSGGLSAGATAGALTLAGQLGARTGTGRTLGPLEVSPALLWGVGAVADLTAEVAFGAEVGGEWWTGNSGQPGAVPSEWLATARFTPSAGPRLRLGLGSGLSPGVGSPDFRLLFGLDGAWGRR